MTATQERSTRPGDKLLGRVAFVTGGTRGIGFALCRSLARQGADVAAGYSGRQERAEMFAQDFSGAYPERHVRGIGQSNYASAKAGLLGLTETLARKAAHHIQRAGNTDRIGVTVDAVTPGCTATEMLDSVPEKVLDGLRTTIPLGRLGEPDEFARVVHFLAADASAYLTGQVRGVDGGLDM